MHYILHNKSWLKLVWLHNDVKYLFQSESKTCSSELTAVDGATAVVNIYVPLPQTSHFKESNSAGDETEQVALFFNNRPAHEGI